MKTYEITFRNLGTQQVKTWTARGDEQADQMIEALRESDTLEFCSAYPID